MNINPCPKCKSTNVEYDSSSMVTSLKGIDYQSGWVECLDCGETAVINGRGVDEVDNLTENVIAKWNNGDTFHEDV